MKKIPLSLLLLLAAASTTVAQHKLEKIWETDSILKVPESVIYDAKNKVLYASNIEGLDPWAKDNKGSIAKIGLDGKIINVDWVRGLNAPKGLGIYKDNLYVADITDVVVIDISKGEIKKRIPVNNAEGLNDLTVDPKGVVYVSDSKTKRVHRIKGNDPAIFLESLQAPNGVLWYDDSLYLLDKGALYRVAYDKQLHKLADNMEGGTDGVEAINKNEFIVSGWAGIIYYVYTNGNKEVLLDTRDAKINSADIGFDPVSRIVYVPTFWKNSVVAYELK